MVKQKAKKKRGKKRRNKKRNIQKPQTPEKSEFNMDIKPKKEITNHIGAKGFNPANEKNNRHRRWDQYYESLFFISHVIFFLKRINIREMKIRN